MILVLGGTGESREVATICSARGYDVLYTSTTGIIAGLPEAVEHVVGELDERSFSTLLQQYPVRCIVDATHPFATAITALAARMAETAGIPCIRLERNVDITRYDDPSVVVADSTAHAAEMIVQEAGGILSTVGTRMLPQLCKALGERRSDLAVRVLPMRASLAECEKCGIHPSRIIALQGPFDKTFNLWCINRFAATTLLTKESGDRGGFGEKVEACRETGCRLVVLRRPAHKAVTVCENVTACLELLAATGCC